MTDREKDSVFLGLREGASDEDIRKAYDLLLHQRTAVIKNGEDTEEKRKEFDEKSEAFNRLLGTAVLTKKGKREKGVWYEGFNMISLKNFWFLYNWQTLVITGVAVIVFGIVYSILTKPSYDFGIYISDGLLISQEKLDTFLHEHSPDTGNILYSDIFDSSSLAEPVDEKLLFVTRYSVQAFDIAVMKRSTFMKYAVEGYFAPLDDYYPESAKDSGKNSVVATINDDVPRLYGIAVDDEQGYLKDFFITGDLMVGMANNTVNPDRAKEMLDAFVLMKEPVH